MGFLSTLVDALGFWFGLLLGLLLGYFLFVRRLPIDVEDPVTRSMYELDGSAVLSLMPDIPLWVKNPDYERVDWLNKIVSFMWPYLDKTICDEIQSIAKPIFDLYVGHFQIKSIKFDHLTLGSLPPIISGVKAFKTQGSELIVQSSIRWAGNANISLELKWLSAVVTLQLVDLQIFMEPRVTLKPLLPTIPCFASVFISLMEKPHIDFGLKLMGGDVMALPGVYRLVQEKIKEQVSNFYHWPKTLEVPILDISSGAANKPVGILHVKVVRALNLQKMDFLGKSDPYVKLKLSNERFHSRKTTVQMRNLNPEWNELFRLTVRDPQTQVLRLDVYDWEKIKAHDKLGMQEIPLSLLTPNESRVFTLNLLKNMNPNDLQNRRNRGKIVLELKFEPFKEDDESLSKTLECNERDSSMNVLQHEPSRSGVLIVYIERAENVEGKHHSNPYALIHFREEKRRTKRIKNNRYPRWSEEFEFALGQPPTDQRIHIEVISKRSRRFMLTSKESLGHVDINLTDVVNNGRINKKYHLNNSIRGSIQVELRWRTV